MGLLDRDFERQLDLDGDEEVRWSCVARHSLDSAMEGGMMFVTTKRFMFVPGRLTGRRRVILRLALTAIESVEVLARTRTIRDGGMKKRVRIGVTGEDAQMFSTARVDKTVAELQSLLFGKTAPPGNQPRAPLNVRRSRKRLD
jgi:hypothetical protein